MPVSPLLSIIIPCYNCDATLAEAVDSIFQQNLKIPFEVVMVNDASRDRTKEVMAELVKKYPKHIKLIHHEKNLGGGAARNTAVKHTSADVIFCLDSDDLLGQGTLEKMYSFLCKMNADGVAVSTSIKFRGTNQNDIAFTNEFAFQGEKIPLLSLFEKKELMCPLYSTFMFTKRAFDVTGGYPTEHGFDTQGFAFRFLCNGLTAYTCPETVYLHRISHGRSYYVREYEAGKLNRNWLNIYEEFFYLFSEQIKTKLLHLDLDDSRYYVHDLLEPNKETLRADYTSFVKPDARKSYESLIRIGKASDKYDFYWLGVKVLKENRYEEAVNFLKHARQLGLNSERLRLKYLEAIARQNKTPDRHLPSELKREIKLEKNGRGRPILPRIANKITSKLKRLKHLLKIVINRCLNTPNPRLFLAWVFWHLRKKIHAGFQQNNPNDVNEVIDVVIPTVSKDYSMLEHVVTSLKYLKHQIGHIYIISRQEPDIADFCKAHGIILVDENTVLGYGKDAINYITRGGQNRSGWLFQQLLKLGADKIVIHENYLVIDSDTIYINNHQFLSDGKYIFLENSEWHRPYFESIKKLFGWTPKNRLSFTSHMMIFNKSELADMKKEMESKHTGTWDRIYQTVIDPQEISAISDYDTYANWMWKRHPEKVLRLPLYNKTLPRTSLKDLKNLELEYGQDFKSLSFHAHVNVS